MEYIIFNESGRIKKKNRKSNPTDCRRENISKNANKRQKLIMEKVKLFRNYTALERKFKSYNV